MVKIGENPTREPQGQIELCMARIPGVVSSNGSRIFLQDSPVALKKRGWAISILTEQCEMQGISTSRWFL